MNVINTIAVMDKIIVKVLVEQTEVTSGGIIVPEVAKDQLKPQGYGEVLSTGNDVREISTGDIIMFNKHAGMDIIIDRSVCKVLKYEEVYGISEKGKAE